MRKKKETNDVQLILSGGACKTTCKVLSVLAKFCEVVFVIAAICCGVCGIAVGLAWNKVDLPSVVDTLKADETFPQEAFELPEVQKFLSLDSRQQLSSVLIVIVVITVMLVFSSILARYVYRLFKNLARARTPFTMENVDILQKIGTWIFVLIAASIISSIVVTLAMGSANIQISISLSTIAIGFMMLVLAVVFRHGVELENKNKNK